MGQRITPDSCPFCGQVYVQCEKSIIIHVFKRWLPERRYYSQYQVECACGAAGPMCDTEAEAIERWNTRIVQ